MSRFTFSCCLNLFGLALSDLLSDKLDSLLNLPLLVLLPLPTMSNPIFFQPEAVISSDHRLLVEEHASLLVAYAAEAERRPRSSDDEALSAWRSRLRGILVCLVFSRASSLLNALAVVLSQALLTQTNGDLLRISSFARVGTAYAVIDVLRIGTQNWLLAAGPDSSGARPLGKPLLSYLQAPLADSFLRERSLCSLGRLFPS